MSSVGENLSESDYKHLSIGFRGAFPFLNSYQIHLMLIEITL